MTGIDALLASLPAWTLVGGKGGVGKTTCAAALAMHAVHAVRAAGEATQTLLLSTDPARGLGDALGVSLGSEPIAIRGAPGLHAAQLDAAAARRAFLARSRELLITVVDRGTYLERDDIAGLVDAALPGADEAMAILTLADFARQRTWARVIVDTAPTGHTLRLLSLPDTFRALVDLLERMQAKHRFIVSALTHRYRPDAVDAFLDDLRAQVAAVRALLTDRARTAIVLVTRPEPVVAAETARYAAALDELRLGVRAVVINAIPTESRSAVADALAQARTIAGERSVYHVQALSEPPIGPDGLARWRAAVEGPVSERAAARVRVKRERARTGTAHGPAKDRAGRSAARTRVLDALASAPPGAVRLRDVTIVGGKGGVGKTSVACALALESARAGRRTLLVSTDPAPSVGDALAEPVADAEREVGGGAGLVARQIDAGAAFARWRDEYQARVDAVFGSLFGGEMQAAHDQAIVRELLSLAPPGIDELYALIWLGDSVAEARFERIVIDPAPTGHLLRLLEMPPLALEWTHRLLRLMLKYRELGGGGEIAGELLAFARRTRAVAEILHDAARTGALIVALDEPLVRLESERLVALVRGLGIDVAAVIWNRVAAPPAPLTVSPPVTQFLAADIAPPPVGAARLRAWREGWRILPASSPPA